MDISLRPALPADRSFVEAVYFETQRWIIERLFGWRGDDIEAGKFADSYNEADSFEISSTKAVADGIPLRLSTAKINPARRLYERLGFAIVREDEYKVYMRRRAEQVAFRPLARTDFADMIRWHRAPHAAEWFAQSPLDLDAAERKYGPRIDGSSPTRMHVVEVPLMLRSASRCSPWLIPPSERPSMSAGSGPPIGFP